MSSEALLTIPSRNIEIKAQIADEEAFQKKVAIAKQLTGSSGEIIKQHDVFFNADKGRLKLRYLEVRSLFNGFLHVIIVEHCQHRRISVVKWLVLRR